VEVDTYTQIKSIVFKKRVLHQWGTTDITSCAPWSVTSLVTG